MTVIENLLIDVEDESKREKAIKGLGQIVEHWKGSESYDLVKETIRRQINNQLKNSTLGSGQEQSALTFAYIKGMTEIIDLIDSYVSEATFVVAQEKQRRKDERTTKKEDEDTYKAGLETGLDSGLSSIVR